MAFAQLGAQAVAEFSDGNGRHLRPELEQRGWRDVAQQIKCFTHQSQRWPAREKPGLGKRVSAPIRQGDAMGEREFLVAVFEERRQRNNLAMELEVTVIEFQAPRQTPAGEPLQKIETGELERTVVVGAVSKGF